MAGCGNHRARMYVYHTSSSLRHLRAEYNEPKGSRGINEAQSATTKSDRLGVVRIA